MDTWWRIWTNTKNDNFGNNPYLCVGTLVIIVHAEGLFVGNVENSDC